MSRDAFDDRPLHAPDSPDGLPEGLPELSAFTAAGEELHPVFDADGHLDDGSIHAWLDGMFAGADAIAIETHVSACAHCQAQVAEARGLLAGSTRILSALDGAPAGVVPAADATRTAARVAQEAVTPGVVAHTRAPARSTRWWQIAAAVAVMAGGSSLVWQRQRAGTASPPAESIATHGATMDSVAAAPARATAAPPSADAPDTSIRVAEAPRDRTTRPSVASSPATATDAVVMAAPAPAVAPRADAQRADAQRAAFAEAPAAAVQRVIVTGRVTDGRRAIPQGVVQIEVPAASPAAVTRRRSFTAVVDGSGTYRVTIDSLRRGDRVLVFVRAIGFARAQQQTVVSGDTVRVDFTLAPLAVAVEQTVAVPQRIANEATRPAPVGSPASPTVLPTVAPAASAGLQLRKSVASPGAGGVGGRRVAVGAPLRLRDGRVSADSVATMNREQYDRIEDNPFLGVRTHPLSTFSVDVDRAAFGNVRRFITAGQRPPQDAVRIEELINYFPYALPAPRGRDPVAITTDVMAAPWQPQHRLVRIALQSRPIATAALPPNNLVFLIDVSGSMQSPDKLPLVKQSLRLLVDQLRPQDQVAIVAYAGAAGLVLPSTSGDERQRIADAIDRLEAGGSTAGGAGIELAYRVAREHFIENGNNRVILATDGDFNVGVSSDGELERLVERKRTEGTYLTVLGFGTGNYQDAKMEKLAKRGNGNYAYVDELSEARKVLVREMGATLLTVANDVKLQVEFNPAVVQAYRLIGYEDRLLLAEDFDDDRKDAGDMGAGHQVTALYEIVPTGVSGTVTVRGTEARRYSTPEVTPRSVATDELLFVKLRYKRPGESASQLLSAAVPNRVGKGTTDTRFAAAVAGFGMLLRDSEHKGTANAAQVLSLARAALGDDEGGYRAAFVSLVERWRGLEATAGARR